jgi:hypothetical protein
LVRFSRTSEESRAASQRDGLRELAANPFDPAHLPLGQNFAGESSTARVLAALGVERLEWATRPMASQAIDAMKAELQKRRSNGHENGASHG